MTEPRSFLDGRVVLHAGDCREVLREMADNSIDSVVCDPPYHLTSIVERYGGKNAKPVRVDNINASNDLKAAYARHAGGFMGKQWDGGDIAFQTELWAEVLRVMKPGAHGLAMGGTRTFHRLACAIEDAGGEIRDCVFYCYGSGFPKSHDIALDYEKEICYQSVVDGKTEWRYHSDGALLDRNNYRHPDAIEWDGYGTALKPAVEPICLFRKPLSEASISENVRRWGTGAINVGATKVGAIVDNRRPKGNGKNAFPHSDDSWCSHIEQGGTVSARWPANLILDGSDEVLECFPESKSCNSPSNATNDGDRNTFGSGLGKQGPIYPGDSGSAARFFASFPQEDVQRIFYTSKAGSDDRLGSSHPTVKPLDLIQYLVRLVTPKNGLCLDLFAGTGTTAEACFREGFRCILIENDPQSISDIERRMSLVMEGPVTRANAGMKARGRPRDDGPLFEAAE